MKKWFEIGKWIDDLFSPFVGKPIVWFGEAMIPKLRNKVIFSSKTNEKMV